MSLLLNILWLILGGFELAVGWWFAGLAMAITIVGLPWAPAAFRTGLYALWPFDSEMVARADGGLGTGPLGAVGNIIWFLIAGWWLALAHLLLGLLMCVSIIGIPFGYAHIKLAGAALFPIGKTIRRKGDTFHPAE